MIYQLDKNIPYFPDPLDVAPKLRRADGLYAIGGELTLEWMLAAYPLGIFPWTAYKRIEIPDDVEPNLYNQIDWYCPVNRFVILPGEAHVSHSMRTLLNKGVYRVTFNEDFDGVVDNCSRLRIDDEGAWLGPRMAKLVKEMHRQTMTQSVEVWHDDRLVGGLYGITLGRGFFGESMFSLEPSASKVALIALSDILARSGHYTMIDCQNRTDHLASMGGRYISYKQYRDLLKP